MPTKRMKGIEGFTDKDIFANAKLFANETNPVYIAEHLESIIREAQRRVKDNSVLGDVMLCETCEKSEGYFSKVRGGYYCSECFDK